MNFVTNLSGRHIGRLHYERMDKEVLDATPEVCAKPIGCAVTCLANNLQLRDR